MLRSILIALVLLALFGGTCLAQPFQFIEVEIEGTDRVDKGAVEAVLSVRSGVPGSAEDIDRDIRSIYDTGRFTDVAAEVEERPGGKVLIFRVTERPLVRSIVFSGNKELKSEKLETLAGIKTPWFHDPLKVRNAAEAIRKAYKEEGYYAADVETKLETRDDNEAAITFEIEEGRKVLVDSIRFEGNTVFTPKQLKKAMVTKERWFLSWLTDRGAFNEEALQVDLEIIADQYYNRGYLQVKVRQPLVTLSDDKKYMDILIEIDEGDQFTVGEIDIRGDLILSREELLGKVRLKEGDVFSRQMLRDDVFAINDLYADRGYAYVNVSPLTHLEPKERRVNLVFEVEKGTRVSIEKIRIAGNTKTRDKVIRREMELVEGELYSATKIKESRRKIKNLGFFDEVDVTTAKGSDEAHMDLDVAVKERPTGSFSLGFGYSSVDGPIGQGSVSQENFLGRALKLNLAGSFGGSSNTYQIGLLDPYFLDTRITLGFDVFKTRREYNDFSKKTTGADLKFGFPLTEKTRAFFIYRYEDKEIFEIDADASRLIREQEGESTLSSIAGSLTRNSTDYRLDPTTGSVSEISIEYAGLGGTEKYSKYILDHRHFFPFKWDTVISAHGRIGYIQEIGGEEIPIDERFFLGGINTIRGFKSREVGPRVRSVSEVVDPETGEVKSDNEDFEFIGGDKAAFFNLEYIFPLSREMGLKGLVFFDTGNAWGAGEEFFSDMRYSVGGGIRWFSPLGPLRLEWGYNLDPLEGEDRSEFEFSVGKFF